MEPSIGKVDDVGTSRPPIDLVVVHEPPSCAKMDFSASASPGIVGQRVPPLPLLSAFRLQPRGNPHMPTPSPSRKDGFPRGRKRDANCLAATLGSTVFAPQTRSLFSSGRDAGATCDGIPTATGNLSTFASTPPRHEFTSGPSHRDYMIESPSRVENALQSLSIQSPRLTPVCPSGESPSTKGRQRSPFRPYSSRSPGIRLRGESLGSLASVTTKTQVWHSTARSSPKTAPLLVLHHDDGNKKSWSSSPPPQRPLFSGGGSPLDISLDNTKNRAAILPMTPSRAPPTITPKERECDSDDVLSTPRSQGGTGTTSSFRTPISRRTLASPFDTPLPKAKLTPRRQEVPEMWSPADLQLPPVDASVLGRLECTSGVAQRRSTSDISPAECVPAPPSGGMATAGGRSPSYPRGIGRHGGVFPRESTRSPRRSLFTYNPSLAPDRDGTTPAHANSVAFAGGSVDQRGRPPVVVRSLLVAPLSPWALQSIAAADARKAARDCDGSLTDDDEDEPFVLADPAVLVEERQAEQPRPSQRRRTSLDDSAAGGLERNGHSTTSLLGIAFVHGESNGGSSSSNHLAAQWSLNDKGLFDQERSDDQHFPSIGLDLDHVSMEVTVQEKGGTPLALLQGRDLQTPPAVDTSAFERSFPPPAPARRYYLRTQG